MNIMTSSKRKADSTASKSSKVGQTLPERPQKRRKSVDAAKDEDAISDNRSSRSQLTSSVVRSEEKSFPRGGASVLTPLEHKQIQNEATRDVLFEQTNGKRKGAQSSDEEAANASGDEAQKASKSKITRRKKKRKDYDEQFAGEVKPKIEALSFKKLNPGDLVLGQVAEITSRDLAIALPNNLTGYVRLTEISDQLNHRIETLLADNDDANASASEENFGDVNLKALFSEGQYVRTYVLSSGSDASTSGKRRIELSLNPKMANSGLSRDEILPAVMLQASVSSVEDHGIIMDLGIQDCDMKGFISAKQMGRLSPDEVQEGQIFLCQVVNVSANERTATLTLDSNTIKNTKRNYLSTSTSVRAFVPGVVVEVLISDVSDDGIYGKVAGTVDVNADMVHVGIDPEKPIENRFTLGQKAMARIIFRQDDGSSRSLGVSFLPPVLALDIATTLRSSGFDVSSIIDVATVIKVVPKFGLYLDIGSGGVGFAHISRLSDRHVEKLSPDSGAYQIGSKHKVRIVGHNLIDHVYSLSLEPKVLSQPFLRVQDVEVGQVVQGSIERLVLNDRGFGGVLVNLAEGISGFAGPLHLSDVQLQHPERKYREGMTVKARVLSVNQDRRRISLTLKKSLVNSEVEPWRNYDLQVGMQSPGTIVNLLPTGAVVQFYGFVRGFLPRDEMSEAFIKDPADHFKLGQVVNVRAVEIDAIAKKMKVSCKDPSHFGPTELKAFNELAIGSITKGMITEIGSSVLAIDLGNGLKGTVAIQHLSDGSEAKNKSLAKRLRVGQTLSDLVVIKRLEKRHVIVLSHKPEIIKAARGKILITEFRQLVNGSRVVGFVRNIHEKLVFVEFAGSVVAIIPASKLDATHREAPNFGYEVGQTISAYVLSVDHDAQRAVLTTGQSQMDNATMASNQSSKGAVDRAEPVSNLSLGQITEARVTAVKPLQLNVELADRLPGRVDTTEIFDVWSDIKDWKHPLVSFKVNQTIKTRVIGLHDAKTRTFLPFSHRRSNTVLELSMRSASSESAAQILHTERLVVGQQYIGIVSKHAEGFLLVKLSPSVTGRLLHTNLSDDVTKLKDVAANFPLGSALNVAVLKVDIEANKVELSNKSTLANTVGFSGISLRDKFTGTIVKVNAHGVLVQINRFVAGFIPLTELADDYSSVNIESFAKNDFVEVKVVAIDSPNKRLTFSSRPSLVAGKANQVVTDKPVGSVDDLSVNDVVRGFVKNIADKGLFLHIGLGVTAFVKVSDLSDAFHKDWKSLFKVGQLVKGKVIKVEKDKSNVLVSLKSSVLDKSYVPLISFADLEVGQIHNAKVRKVESFGVFVIVDGSNNVSGLCHRSEIADGKVTDVTKLYDEGDVVKAIVLKVDKAKKRVNFGLKKSYFNDEGAIEGDDSDADTPADSAASESGDELFGGSDVQTARDKQFSEEGMDDSETVGIHEPVNGLAVGGFDWTGEIGNENDEYAMDVDLDLEAAEKKRKKKKPTITVDKTGELDKYGPQGVADFERLLLGKPNSSRLWIQYMALQLGLGEVDKARAIAERALKTIHIREEDEKLNVWIALLNLENTYGSEETLQEVFTRASGLNDKQEIHERLVSIFIESGKEDKAEELFQQMTKMKELTMQVQFWTNYATFLLSTRNNADAARSLLMRAMQSVAETEHRNLTSKFGALEFTSPNGDTERGRTVFEGLLSTWPKRTELWDMYVDLEANHGKQDNVRELYERMTKQKLKKRRAKYVFKRWLEFEEKTGDAARIDHVTALATAYVKKLQGAGPDDDEY